VVLALVAVLAGGAAAFGAANAPSAAASAEPGTELVDGDTVPSVASLGPTSFTVRGPFAAGETTLHLPAGEPVEVWYPATTASAAGRAIATYNVADWLPATLRAQVPAGYEVTYPTGGVRGLPVAAGRFALVVFCHGFSGFRDQSTFLTSWLATWGFVVAAPDLADNDLTAVFEGHLAGSTVADVVEVERTIMLMESESATAGSPFEGRVDSGRIATVGHSLGGEISEQVAAVDPSVTTFIGMAGASVGAFDQGGGAPVDRVPDKPGMLMAGADDHVAVPLAIAGGYKAMKPPKRLIVLGRSGHLVFADVCQVGKAQGGLLAIAAAVHITVPPELRPLAVDGCQPPDLPVTEAWPAVRQSVTAQLRYVFGFDASPAGLSGLTVAFPDVVSRNVYVAG